MAKIEVEIKEHKGVLGFGTRYTAEVSERSNIGFSINQTYATNVSPEHAVADAVEKFMDNKEK